MQNLYIALFGLLGVFARFYIKNLMGRGVFPFDTFIVNMLGAFFIGLIYVFGVERVHLSPELKLGIVIGFLGGFTTFSTYCIEVIELYQKGNVFYSLAYLILSPVLGVLFSFFGIIIARKF